MIRQLRLPTFFAILSLTPHAGWALAQDLLTEAPQAPASLAPDALSLAHSAAARGDNAEALSRYLRFLSTAPDNVPALVGAGQAALAVGDLNAAAGFLARADALDPRNGQVKAGLAETMVQNGNARGALRLFNDAVSLGVAPATIAADRGLAYDLRGDQRRAQADYQLALRTHPDDETTRRLAISQAIAGDRTAALATLDPLLRRQDVPAWRARAFVLALTGTTAEGQQGAALVMPRDQVDALTPYLARMATLKPADKAAAIHLGRFPDAVRPPVQQVATTPSPPPPRLTIDRAALAPQTFAGTEARAATGAAVQGATVPLARAQAPVPVRTPTATATAMVPVNPAAAYAERAPQEQRRMVATGAGVQGPAASIARTQALPPVAAAAPANPPAPSGATSLAAPGAMSTLSRSAGANKSVPLPSGPSPAELAAKAKADAAAAKAKAAAQAKADAKARAAAKAKAEAAALEKEAREKEAEERAAARKNPARQWVQVAGGANKADLGRAWDKLKERWPKQLAGRTPWTVHYRFTNRLMIGPFQSSDAAQKWVTERNKEGLASFRVETKAGEEVERVD